MRSGRDIPVQSGKAGLMRGRARRRTGSWAPVGCVVERARKLGGITSKHDYEVCSAGVRAKEKRMESCHQEFAPNQGWDHQRVLTFHTARHGARLRNRRQAYHVGLLAVRQTTCVTSDSFEQPVNPGRGRGHCIPLHGHVSEPAVSPRALTRGRSSHARCRRPFCRRRLR